MLIDGYQVHLVRKFDLNKLLQPCCPNKLKLFWVPKCND